VKILLFALAILIVAAGLGTRAVAQNYPWCAIFDGGANSTSCSFDTVAQCMATVSGVGGFCMPNNLYQPPAATPARRKHNSSSAFSHATVFGACCWLA